jgi:capsular polysaccharide biosynthesis protein
MDLFSIVRVIWRNKIAVIPVIILVIVGIYYILEIKPPVYNTSASVLLVNPPNPPTAQQIVQDPGLAKINSNNPYVNDGLQTVADILINLIGSADNNQALIKAGADPRYQAALSADFGNPPIIEVTGIASTPQGAVKSANLVVEAVNSDLKQIQKVQGVNDTYLIKAINVIPAHGASLTRSGKLRTLIALLGLGTILMLVVISVAEALRNRRTGSSAAPGSTTPSRDSFTPRTGEIPRPRNSAPRRWQPRRENVMRPQSRNKADR